MTVLYSFKTAYPHPLPTELGGYSLDDFVLADPAPELAPGEVLEWNGTAWYVRGPSDAEQAFKIYHMRQERNRMLSDCDWTQVADAPVDSDAWAAYRQALREVPDQAGFPWTIEWPQTP